MELLLRKITIISIAGFFAVALLAGVWHWAGKNRTEIYSSASSESGLLETDFENRQISSLKDWEKQILERSSEVNSASANVNNTNIAALEAFGQYLKSKQSGQEQSGQEIDKDKIAGSALVNVLPENYEVDYKKYGASELKISSQSDSASLKIYGNEIGRISKESHNPDLGNEIAILFNALKQENANELKKLDPIIENYEILAKKTMALETPKETAGYHLEMANTFSEISSTIKDLKNYLSDPVRGFAALSNYMNLGFQLQLLLKGLDNFYKSKGITFTEEEDGFLIGLAANYSLPDIDQQ